MVSKITMGQKIVSVPGTSGQFVLFPLYGDNFDTHAFLKMYMKVFVIWELLSANNSVPVFETN